MPSRGKTYRVAACLANDEDPNTLLTISIKGGHVEVCIVNIRAKAATSSAVYTYN